MKQTEIIIQRTSERMTRSDIVSFVQTACEFQCTILIRSGDFQVNAKSLLGVIALQMEPGMKLCISTKGPGEDLALSEICEWFS